MALGLYLVAYRSVPRSRVKWRARRLSSRLFGCSKGKRPVQARFIPRWRLAMSTLSQLVTSGLLHLPRYALQASAGGTEAPLASASGHILGSVGGWRIATALRDPWGERARRYPPSGVTDESRSSS